MAKKSKKSVRSRGPAPVGDTSPVREDTPAPPLGEVIDTPSLRAIYSVVLPVLAAFMAIFITGVYAYGTYGGPWVDGLDEQIAEVVARRAEDLHNRGHRDEAIEEYRRACQARFDDPTQQVWIRKRLGELLLRERRAEEASAVALEMLSLNIPGTSDWTARALFVDATKMLITQTNGAPLIAASEAWLAKARALNDTAAVAQGLFGLGKGYALEGRHTEALAALTESNDLSASPDRALAIAHVLLALARKDDARTWVDAAYTKGEGETRATAAALLRDVYGEEITAE